MEQSSISPNFKTRLLVAMEKRFEYMTESVRDSGNNGATKDPLNFPATPGPDDWRMRVTGPLPYKSKSTRSGQWSEGL